ncbi:MAG: type II secretion system F family protein [Beijerinckiaceae bacterium]|nr:type II secretion system F family protein [Beijerinckiaceae bacterium]
MLYFFYAEFFDPQFMLSVLVAIATMATVVTIAMPIIETDVLSQRMKAVATERERIRARERERLVADKNKRGLRQEPKVYMKQIVERFSLSKWLGTDHAKSQMTMAGFRGPQAEVAFLFFRLVVPLLTFAASASYIFLAANFELPFPFKAAIILLAAYLGLKAPELYLKNTISKRQASMGRAFPDALDLLLICVESGISIEHAFRKVAQEIGIQSVPLAEELTLATAELSFLPDRRLAFENLGLRTGLDSVKQIATVLIQAERYGTPLGTALRVVAEESRSQRMMTAEKKAAALPPKLTVPMILFFLPVLFAIIMTPAIIQVSRTVS